MDRNFINNWISIFPFMKNWRKIHMFSPYEFHFLSDFFFSSVKISFRIQISLRFIKQTIIETLQFCFVFFNLKRRRLEFLNRTHRHSISLLLQAFISLNKTLKIKMLTTKIKWIFWEWITISIDKKDFYWCNKSK